MSLSKREELVSELTSFYEFLVGLHLPADALKRPPPGGWPDINQKELGYLNKDDDVIDILKHIPYIRRDGPLNPFQIYEKTVCNDFTGTYFARFGKEYQTIEATEPFEEEVDSSVATLAKPESRDGYYIFYHTAEHTMRIVDYQVDEIREAGVAEFFQTLKNEYRELLVFPVEPESVIMTRRSYADTDQLHDLFRQHGWPTADFRKDQCLDAAKKLYDTF